MDLIRHTQDPQDASKALVDHALARFSTDNLSCMVVRFDNKALQRAVNQQTELIGVEGDPATQHGGISEAEAIVLESKKKLEESGEYSDRPTAEVINEAIQQEESKEPGPELNLAAIEAARKDVPQPHAPTN